MHFVAVFRFFQIEQLLIIIKVSEVILLTNGQIRSSCGNRLT